jgi:hypothetical protein
MRTKHRRDNGQRINLAPMIAGMPPQPLHFLFLLLLFSSSFLIINSHPQSDKIHSQIDKIESKLMKDGYKHDTSWVMQDAYEERKKHLLCRHSEKLALAYALLKSRSDEILSFSFLSFFFLCGDCPYTFRGSWMSTACDHLPL